GGARAARCSVFRTMSSMPVLTSAGVRPAIARPNARRLLLERAFDSRQYAPAPAGGAAAWVGDGAGASVGDCAGALDAADRPPDSVPEPEPLQPGSASRTRGPPAPPAAGPRSRGRARIVDHRLGIAGQRPDRGGGHPQTVPGRSSRRG